MDIQVQEAAMRSRLEIYQAALENFTGNIDNNLGQLAAAVKLRIAAMQLGGRDSSKEEMEETQNMLSELIRGLQDISNNSYIICLSQMNIVGAMEMEADRISKAINQAVPFSVNGTVYPVAMDKAVILFRTWQQVMNEVTAKDECNHLSVAIDFKPCHITIRIGVSGPITDSIFSGDVFDRAGLAGIQAVLENKTGKANTNSIILDLNTC